MERTDLSDCLYVQARKPQNLAQAIERLEGIAHDQRAQFISEHRLVLQGFFLTPIERSKTGSALLVGFLSEKLDQPLLLRAEALIAHHKHVTLVRLNFKVHHRGHRLEPSLLKHQPKSQADLAQKLVELSLVLMSLLYELEVLGKASVLVGVWSLCEKLKLEVHEFMQAHTVPYHLVIDQLKKVLQWSCLARAILIIWHDEFVEEVSERIHDFLVRLRVKVVHRNFNVEFEEIIGLVADRIELKVELLVLLQRRRSAHRERLLGWPL